MKRGCLIGISSIRKKESKFVLIELWTLKLLAKYIKGLVTVGINNNYYASNVYYIDC